METNGSSKAWALKAWGFMEAIHGYVAMKAAA